MKATRRPRLFVEQLETRDCPTFVLRLVDGTLFLTGAPTPGAGAALRLLQTAPNQWEVIDGGGGQAAPAGGSILGKYDVNSLNVDLTQHQNAPVIFDLGGFTSTGNITLNLGTGDNTNFATNGVTIYNGMLTGNVLILNGSGEERYQLGYLPITTGSGFVAGAVTIAGNVNIIARENPNAIQGGGPVGNTLDTGTEPATDPSAVTIGGSLTTVGVGEVQLAQMTTVGGNVSQTMLRAQMLSGLAGDLFWGTIDGNLTIQGAPSSSGDVIQIGDGIDVAAINGNLNISLGGGDNQLSLTGPFVVGGNTNIQSGDGNSSISLGGTFGSGTVGGQYNGDLNVQLGNGNNTDGTTDPLFYSPNAFLPASTTVSGNFTLTAGNGNNNLTTTGNPLAAAIGGTTNITFGNGNDSPFTVGASLGGTFNWHSGNGNDSLAFAGATAPVNVNVNITFGNGNDSLAFNDPAGSTFSGSVNGNGGSNSFFQATGNNLVSPFQLSNFG